MFVQERFTLPSGDTATIKIEDSRAQQQTTARYSRPQSAEVLTKSALAVAQIQVPIYTWLGWNHVRTLFLPAFAQPDKLSL